MSPLRRRVALCAFVALSSCTARGGTEAGRPVETPTLDHVHLNSVDPAAALEWYRRLWPEGRAGRVGDDVAFVAEMAVAFRKVERPAPGAWNHDLQRAEPQSPFWHLGAFVNTTELLPRLQEEGFPVLPLMVSPADETGVVRSGLTPYEGIQTRTGLAQAAPAPPRDGGFGYLVGPDGALVELTGSPRSTASFSHVHLFHEQPRCAANWYVDNLGMTLPPRRDPATGDTIAMERWDACAEAEDGEAGWPSLERIGTLRAPSATIRYASGSISFYPRQCRAERCGVDQPLVPSRGQVLDHVAFRVTDLQRWAEHLQTQGVRVLEPLHPLGAGQALLIEGPDGLSIELVEGEVRTAPDPA